MQFLCHLPPALSMDLYCSALTHTRAVIGVLFSCSSSYHSIVSAVAAAAAAAPPPILQTIKQVVRRPEGKTSHVMLRKVIGGNPLPPHLPNSH